MRTLRSLGAGKMLVILAASASVFSACSGGEEERPLPPGGPPGPIPRTIEANGRFFLADEDGRALVLHGVNLIDDFNTNSAKPTPGILTGEDFKLLADLGFNVVRLTRFWQALEPQQGLFDEAYFDRTRQLLDWCSQYGLYAVLDMHQDIYSHVFTGRGMPEWVVRSDGIPFEPIQPWWLNNVLPAVTRSWDHFWRDEDIQQAYTNVLVAYARRFKDHPCLLGYDLINEPYQGSMRVDEFEKTVLVSAYEDWIEAIRREDPRHWIFYEPVSWIVNTSLAPSHIGVVGEEQAVYFPHLYMYTNDLNLPWNGDPAFVYTWEGRAVKILRQQRCPGMIGEFGVNASVEGHNDFLREVLAMADRSLCGWVYWEYGYVKEQYQGRAPSQQEFIHILSQPYARRVAGTPLFMRFDSQGKVFELEFIPSGKAGASTEIFVSASRHYPDGWRIATSDKTGRWSLDVDPATGVLRYYADPEEPWCTVRIEPR
jgi:endoglycosylceramidase